MRTEKQILAARLNGAKSHGAITAAGKLRSSQNAIRHGLLADAVVLHNEDSNLFTQLLASLDDEFQPDTPSQRALVDKMAVALWRQLRIWTIEKESYRLEIQQQVLPGHSPAARAAIAFRRLHDESRALELLNRYDTRYDRQYARSLRLLQDAKKVILPNEPGDLDETKE